MVDVIDRALHIHFGLDKNINHVTNYLLFY